MAIRKLETLRASVEVPMAPILDRDLIAKLGKGRTNAMLKHPWFQEYRNYEHAYKYGVDKWGFAKVQMYAYFSSVHKTTEGKIRPELMLEFCYSYTGTKVVQVEKYARDKIPSDIEKRWGPSAGWKHLKSFVPHEDLVNDSWEAKHKS